MRTILVILALGLCGKLLSGCAKPDPKVAELAAQGVACNARSAAVIAQGKFLGHSCQENLLAWQIAMTTDPNCVAYMNPTAIASVHCKDGGP